jgi:sugar phosphate isomerase/epimerase
MRPGIALQLYTLREPARTDLPGTLKRVRDIGWEFVQWSGMPSLPADEIRAALEDADLEAVAGHEAVEPFENDFDNTLRHWTTVGVTDLAVGSMMDGCRDSVEAWMTGAERLDRLGARLRDAGIRYSYHNHAFEFEPIPGSGLLKFDILFDVTSPDNLKVELDTAWVQYGGQDPAAYLRKYAGRCPVIHVKDIDPDAPDGEYRFTELGRGTLDWPAIFDAAREAGVQWYIYEQDTCPGDPLESARISYEFLKDHI